MCDMWYWGGIHMPWSMCTGQRKALIGCFPLILHSFVSPVVSEFPASTFNLCIFLHVSERKLLLKKENVKNFEIFCISYVLLYKNTVFIIISSYYHLRTLLLLLSFYKLIFWCNGKSQHLPTENVWLFAERLSNKLQPSAIYAYLFVLM